MSALQYADIPGYSAIIFRRTFSQLNAASTGLIPRSKAWLKGTAALWNESKHMWTFPSGAVLQFGHLQRVDDVYNYQGPEYQFLGFDELTQFTEFQYTYLFSRLRRLVTSDVPLRVRSTSNPGGLGHDWVKRRFIDEGLNHGRAVIRAFLDDNPSLDRTEYLKSLAELDPITRAQLLGGDWSVNRLGTLMQRQWFDVVEEVPIGAVGVRFWDFAATDDKEEEAHDPDFTAGGKLYIHNGVWYLSDMQHVRRSPREVDKLVAQTAALDGPLFPIRAEQEPGASGKAIAAHIALDVLPGYDFKAFPSSANKIQRARPMASAAEAGNFKLVKGGPDSTWIGDFLDEIDGFPLGAHDDQVDVCSGAMMALRMYALGPRKNVMEHTAYGPSTPKVTVNNPLGLDLSPGSPYRDKDVDYDN